MHRRIPCSKTPFYIVLFAASYPLLPAHTLSFDCKTMFTTNFSFAVCVFVCITVFISFENVFFRMTSFFLRSRSLLCWSFWHFTRLYMNLVQNTVFLCHLKTIKNTFISSAFFSFCRTQIKFKHTHAYTFFVVFIVVVVTAPDNFSIHRYLCELLLVLMQCEWKPGKHVVKNFFYACKIHIHFHSVSEYRIYFYLTRFPRSNTFRSLCNSLHNIRCFLIFFHFFPLILMEFSFCKYFMFYENKILELVSVTRRWWLGDASRSESVYVFHGKPIKSSFGIAVFLRSVQFSYCNNNSLRFAAAKSIFRRICVAIEVAVTV